MKNGLYVDKYGTKEYYLNDELHRVDGPAEEYLNGSTFWCLHGKLHRVDGPAIEWKIGLISWYLHGKELTRPEEFKTMEEFIQKINDNEEYSLQWINDVNGIIEMIKEPSDKQTRLHAMRWKI